MTITVNPHVVAPGGRFVINLSNYTPNSSVFLITQAQAGKPLVIPENENGIAYPIGSNGTATINVDVVSNAVPGDYAFQIYDANLTQVLDSFTLTVSTSTGGGGFNFDPMTILLIGGIGVGLLLVFASGKKGLLGKII